MSTYNNLHQEYSSAPSWDAPVKVDSNQFLAANFAGLTVFLLALTFFGDKTTPLDNLKYIALSAAASLAFGFAAVFISDYVGVYV